MMTVFVHWIAGCNRNQLNEHQMCHYEHLKDPPHGNNDFSPPDGNKRPERLQIK